MKLHTLWKMWDDEVVEMVFALDESTVENNWQAWLDGIDAACERYGITEADLREVVLIFNGNAVFNAFAPVQVDASAEPASSPEEPI